VIGDAAGEKKSVARRSTGLDYSSSRADAHHSELMASVDHALYVVLENEQPPHRPGREARYYGT
jgi:hypothetical protein